ncbi:branched-chain amino acid ABC transporter permease [uncultured Sphaerochaeta sp.]|uniref:branched-chain amino acid ABC transporter permease n=1 Tax=uncultured Sphaerochaeta sp. TaxID=886478 RepID=UPI002A0A581C|nr:branched-chain amino acid ABC transporter permease [uncultured Sphaerochaeta sp.]
MVAQLLINGISLGAVYALIAVGFAVVFSVLKFSNFAHGGMISACAYIGFFFQRSFEPAPSILLTILFTGVCGMGIALFLDAIAYRSIRRNKSPNIYYFLSSLTISIIIEQILNIGYSKNPYAYPNIFASNFFMVGTLRVSTMDTLIMIVSLFVLVLMILLITKTKIGLAIRAVAINADTSRLMGINSSFIVVMVFLIAGFLAGVSGVMLGAKYSVYPDLGQTMMVKGFIASVIGGLGSLGGAIAAAIILGVLEIFWTYFFGAFSAPVMLFVLMLLFLFIRPQGIAGKFVKEKV